MMSNVFKNLIDVNQQQALVALGIKLRVI